MKALELNRKLVSLKLPPSSVSYFERAIFAVLDGEPDKVVGIDDDGDEIYAKALLDAFDMNAADYD